MVKLSVHHREPILAYQLLGYTLSYGTSLPWLA
jgi:hypothetical protein